MSCMDWILLLIQIIFCLTSSILYLWTTVESTASSSWNCWHHPLLGRAALWMDPKHPWTLVCWVSVYSSQQWYLTTYQDVARCPLEDKIGPTKSHWSKPSVHCFSVFLQIQIPKVHAISGLNNLDNFYSSLSSCTFLAIYNVSLTCWYLILSFISIILCSAYSNFRILSHSWYFFLPIFLRAP